MYRLCICFVLLLCSSVLHQVRAALEPSPIFPLPKLEFPDPDDDSLLYAFAIVQAELKNIARDGRYNKSSFSVDVTSSKHTLWKFHHTAEDPGPRGVREVDDTAVYRIASISKVFTVLGLLYQQKAGNLSLDDPVNRYLAPLNQSQTGHIPWHDITIRSLASQLSGLPRDVLQGDLINHPESAAKLGLPPVSQEGPPKCDEYHDYHPSCSAEDLFKQELKQEPLFAPNQRSTYSNDAFNLLGLVLANVTGMSYSEYMRTAIFEPLNLTQTSLDKPKDSTGVIPDVDNFWDVEMGVQQPTGGIYTSSSDLSAFLRYVLTHYNGITPQLNWMNPVSFGIGSQNYFGMPWEMFRTQKILPSTRRPVTFVTKSGGVPGYTSLAILAPEYDIGITILIAGNPELLGKMLDFITVPLIRAAEQVAMKQLDEYTGTYVSTKKDLNTTMTIRRQLHYGLTVTDFTSNGTDVLAALRDIGVGGAGPRTRFTLTPTLLFKYEKSQHGERWRIMFVHDDADLIRRKGDVWSEWGINNVDLESYAGAPLNELVFWRTGGDGIGLELSGYRVTLRRTEQGVDVHASDANDLGAFADGMEQKALGSD